MYLLLNSCRKLLIRALMSRPEFGIISPFKTKKWRKVSNFPKYASYPLFTRSYLDHLLRCSPARDPHVSRMSRRSSAHRPLMPPGPLVGGGVRSFPSFAPSVGRVTGAGTIVTQMPMTGGDGQFDMPCARGCAFAHGIHFPNFSLTCHSLPTPSTSRHITWIFVLRKAKVGYSRAVRIDNRARIF